MGWGDAIGGTLQQNGPASPGVQQVGSQLGQMQGLYNQFNTGVLAPMNAQADYNIGLLGVQQADQNASYGMQQSALQQQLAAGMGQIGIQQGALGRQQALLPQEADLQKQLFGLNNQGFGIQQQGLDLQTQIANSRADQQKRGAWSSATAAGATNTKGFGQQLTDIGTQLQQQLAGIGLSEQQLNLSKQREGIQEKQYDLSYSEQVAQLNDTAKRLGLESTDLKARINNALGQLGLSQSMSDVQIIQGINDIQNGRYTAIGNVLGQISQIDPRLLAPTGGR